MHFEPRTALGLALRLSLLFLWQQLRIAMNGLHPHTPWALWRIARAAARMHTLVARLDRLALRWLEGTLPKPRAPRARGSATPGTPAAPAEAGPALGPAPARPPRERDPTNNAWLVRAWQPAAQGAATLEHILATRKDLRALVAASPQAARLLRPLARMFGARLPEWLALPPRPRTPRPRKPRPRRPPRYDGFKDPQLKWRPWEKRAARSFLKKYGRG